VHFTCHFIGDHVDALEKVGEGDIGLLILVGEKAAQLTLEWRRTNFPGRPRQVATDDSGAEGIAESGALLGHLL